jgi:HNH endonuclease
MSEIRVIPGDERYGVTPDGRVWSKWRGNEWRELTPTPNTRGYPKVKLAHGKTVQVHVLVAQIFIGRRPAGMTVNHKDGDKWNRAVTNLEYITQGENNSHAWATGLQRSGWNTRRARLEAMGAHRFGPNGVYPGVSTRRASVVS